MLFVFQWLRGGKLAASPLENNTDNLAPPDTQNNPVTPTQSDSSQPSQKGPPPVPIKPGSNEPSLPKQGSPDPSEKHTSVGPAETKPDVTSSEQQGRVVFMYFL